MLFLILVLPPVPNALVRLALRISLRSSPERDHGPQWCQMSCQISVRLLLRGQLMAQNEGLHVPNPKQYTHNTVHIGQTESSDLTMFKYLLASVRTHSSREGGRLIPSNTKKNMQYLQLVNDNACAMSSARTQYARCGSVVCRHGHHRSAGDHHSVSCRIEARRHCSRQPQRLKLICRCGWCWT